MPSSCVNHFALSATTKVALAGATSLLALLALQALRLRRAARRVGADAARAAQWPRPGATQRLLLLGDSTGVGLGCLVGRECIASHMAREWPQAEVVNACTSGARVSDALAQAQGVLSNAKNANAAGPGWLASGRSSQPTRRPFDLVIVLVGGNDVLRLAPRAALARQARALLAAANALAPHVVWVGSANVGCAPLFIAPFSWLLSWHAQRCSQVLAVCAGQAGAAFVDFCHSPWLDPFSADPQRYFAGDGVHPSGAAYALCWRRIRQAARAALGPGAAASVDAAATAAFAVTAAAAATAAPADV